MALQFRRNEVEKIVIHLAKSFNICLLEKTAHYSLVTGGASVLGHLMAGKLGALVGGFLGYHLAGATEGNKLTFEQYWNTLGNKGLPLLKKVYERLRQLEISDYGAIITRLAINSSLKMELAFLIKDFLIKEFGKNVVCDQL